MAIEQRTSIREQVDHTKAEAQAIRDELSSIGNEIRELLELERDLVKAETSEATGHITKGATFGGVAAVMGLITAIFAFLTLMFGLNEFLELWLSALITTLVAGVLLAIFAFMARSQIKQFSPMPRRFMRSIQEDMQWARTQIKSSVR